MARTRPTPPTWTGLLKAVALGLLIVLGNHLLH